MPLAPPPKPGVPGTAQETATDWDADGQDRPGQAVGGASDLALAAPGQAVSRQRDGAAVLDGPGALMGMTPEALTELLGEPSVVRREAPAQIWQYRQAACVFDIFLYEEADRLTVAYVESRDHQARKLPVESCLPERP